MNCNEAESLLLAERDGALAPAQDAALAQHVADCPACRQLQGQLAAALTAWKSDVTRVAVPEPEAAWQALRPHLARRSAAPRRKLAPVIWLGAPLAAAAALAFVFFTSSPAVAPQAAAAPAVARAEFVEPGNANAATMVYVDKDSGWLVVWASDTAPNGKG